MLFHMARTGRSRMGFLLAGGESSRMGGNIDKAFLDFRGQTLLDRALAVMGTVCGRVTIVGDPAKFAQYRSSESRSWEWEPVVGDIFPGCGPLAGIHAALVHSRADLNLMLAVDMPFVSSELLASLASDQALRAGKYKVDAAFSSVAVRVIEEDELTAAGFSEQSFFNVNTPQDRLAAEGRDLDSPS